MEKGVTYRDLDIFVSVGLGNSNESIIEGWSVRKSKHNRFVITPNGYLLNIFTMLPLLMFGIPLTFFGIVMFGEPTIPEEIDLIFFSCKQNPRKEFPIIIKTLEDSLGLSKLFDSAENK